MTTSDEGVREIQLNGKQLVFLFMAVTVVSVVIFLCGVLVGRGVQRRTTLVDAPAVVADDGGLAADATPGVPAPTGPTTATGLSFPNRLDSPQPPPEKLGQKREPPAAAAPGPASSTPAARVPSPATPPAATVPAASTPRPAEPAAPPPAAAAAPAKPSPGVPVEPRGNGFAIQVAALRDQAEAEGLVKRLVGKGYAAYVLPPSSGQPNFRVRVGKFPERSEAEKVASRLEREEQFKPWITR